jgi:5-methylcytosine-specific restriction endonuclease McrA
VIPVVPQPEPDVFDELVRNKGIKFLSKFTTSKPTTKQWNEHDYWGYVRKQLYKAYNGICAYSAHWIPLTTNPNIDHYIPKSVNPNLAYEWSNYRLACSLVNALKKDYQDVLDPFLIKKDWFILDFPSLLVKANSVLSSQKLQEVKITIERLKLNDDKFVNDRDEWLKRYCLGEANFILLKKVAPFIAYELERQGLIEDIKSMMAYMPDLL